MKITFKLYASLDKYLPQQAERNITHIEVAPQNSVYDIVDRFHVPRDSAHLILINGLYIEPEDRDRAIFKEGDTLAIWPPVAGG